MRRSMRRISLRKSEKGKFILSYKTENPFRKDIFVKILGIESSCDETAAAVLSCGDGFDILSNIVASQIEVHARFGGVVPEIASRAHCEAVSKITYDALEAAGASIRDIDVIAVTASPGLIGALLVGVNFAKSLAYANDKPLVAVNHIKGHIAANYLCPPALKPPYLAFVASGGHTSIAIVHDYNHIEEIGGTRDDAMGECFDKVARVLGMPYPGGAAIDKLAYEGKPTLKLPSAAIHDETLDFSFSGIKTAVLNHLNSASQKGEEICREDVAASFVTAAVNSAVVKLDAALERHPELKTLALAGGVAANSHLRTALSNLCEKRKIAFHYPEIKYCGDNAAMIAAAGYFEAIAGNFADTSLNASAFFTI